MMYGGMSCATARLLKDTSIKSSPYPKAGIKVRYQVDGAQNIGSNTEGERLRIPRHAGVSCREISRIRLPLCSTGQTKPFYAVLWHSAI